MRKVILSLFLLSLFCQQQVKAQQPVSDLTSKQKNCFAESCRSLGLHNPQFFYQNQINISETKDFRKNGVDLQQMSRRWNGFTPLEQVLLVPNIVRARVIGMEEAPSVYGQFRMIYSIAVLNTISGEELPSKIEVYSRSHGGNGSFFTFNNEPVLQLGEEVVLYLNKVPFSPPQKKERKPGEPQLEQISWKPAQAQQTEPQELFVATVKYLVKNGQLLDAWNRPFVKEEEFTKLAGKIYKINNRKKFFSRSYC